MHRWDNVVFERKLYYVVVDFSAETVEVEKINGS